MSVKPKTPERVFEEWLKGLVKRLEQAIINALLYVGETCLTEARLGGTYTDRTGNLRSSIGYVVVKDGKVIQRAGFDSSDGGKAGEQFAKEVVNKFPKGIVLIVVAGMHYASYVAAKGYNVLDSAEDMAERLVPKIMKELGFKVAA